MKTETKAGTAVASEANKIYALTNDKKLSFNRLWIWPAAAMTAGGKRTANAGNVYIGERTSSGDHTPDQLATGDAPILIELPQGETKLVSEVIFQADTASDGVYFKYW